VSFDMAAWTAAILVQGGIVSLLIWRRVFRNLPLFVVYVVWGLLSDILGITLEKRDPHLYEHWFLYEMPFDCLLQFGVLIELAWAVLRPARASLPRTTIFVIIGMFIIAGILVWPIAGVSVLPHLSPAWHYLMRVQQTFSILRILFFLFLAGGSKLLALTPRDRELQVATGLGFYSLASLAIAVIHSRIAGFAHYHLIDQVGAVSYLVCLIYWAYSFWQKEAARHEFSPQMQSFLLAVSKTARTSRIALQENNLHGDHRP
jgi:hypothetical protein